MGAMGYSLASGQFISDRNVSHRDSVAVLGNKTAADLFGEDDPVGQRVKIKGRRFTVIGVLEAKGGAMMGISQDEKSQSPPIIPGCSPSIHLAGRMRCRQSLFR